MRRFVYVFVLTLALVLPFPATFAQRRATRASAASAASSSTQRGVDLITAAQEKDYLTFIASDEMEGRDTPSRGLDTVARFIAMNLSRWGFKPAGDDGTYFQRIALKRERVSAAQTRIEFNGQTFNGGEDFIAGGTGGSVTGPLVYAGNGWLFKSKNMDAYKGIDARNKIVVISAPLDSLPKGVSMGDLRGTRGVDWIDPAAYAEKQGAKAVLVIPDFQTLSNWDRTRQRLMERGVTTVEKFQDADDGNSHVLRIILSPRMAAALLQGEKQNAATIFEGMSTGNPVEPFDFSASKSLSINVAAKSDTVMTQNVVAVWEGSDPVLKNEYVAVGAHYDHIGIGTPVNGDAIYNGADDDGSGTTAVLSMAEALAHAPTRPKRSVLLVWHAGEEKGLWGSRYFTDNPTIPLDRVVTQLNIDMIGRSKKEGDTNPRNAELSGPNEIYVIGSKMMSTELGQLSDRVNQSYLNLTYNFKYDDPNDPNRFFFRSDHFNYARKGIPIIFFFDGEHEDYHRPGDEVSKIDFQKMEKVTRTVYTLLWEVASLPTRPKVDKQLPQGLRGE